MSTDPDNPEVLTRVPTEWEAAAILSALADRGIHALTTGGFTAGFRAESPGDVNIIVKHQDLKLALEALKSIELNDTAVDWSQVDVGKPEDS
ncbi:MAG TPA: hypothetical protein VMM56_07195 [Planctomycetaceae bacterium]|nr:hypothetical protein [Planctomycetaceae bacterium]